MPLFLTDAQKALRETVRKFTEEEIIPVRAELDENEEYPERIVSKLIKELHLACPFVPKEYGGAGLGTLESALIAEELSRGCLGISTAYSVSGLGVYPLLLAGSHELKLRHIPDIAKGEKTAAFALTEATAGSDIANIKTTAEKKGSVYILNGIKQWITSSSKADVYSVFAITNKTKGVRGISCFIVEKGSKGLSFGTKERKLGIRCSETGKVIFENCEVPAENLIGKEGHGFKYAIDTFNHSKPVVAAAAVGVAQAAFEIAIKYATGRIQFGAPISSQQAIQHKLADMATLIEAGRLLAYNAARMVDSDHPSNQKYSSMAKSFCGENAFNIANMALQITGKYGYTRDFPIEKIFRDARILSIYEGTTEIQKNTIARDLIKESKSKPVRCHI